MSNLLKTISYRVMFSALICAIVFMLSDDAAAQQITKKRGNLESKTDIKNTPLILIPGIGGSDLDYQPPKSRGIWRNGFPNDVLKGEVGEPENLQFDEGLLTAVTY